MFFVKISYFVDIRDTGQKCAIIAVSQLGEKLEKQQEENRGECKWGIIILQMAALSKSDASVKRVMLELGRARLILRKRQGHGSPDLTYVLV